MLLGAYYLLGACYLPCAKDHLLSACAINRVHDGGERSSETMVPRARSTFDGHSEVKQRRATQVFLLP